MVLGLLLSLRALFWLKGRRSFSEIGPESCKDDPSFKALLALADSLPALCGFDVADAGLG